MLRTPPFRPQSTGPEVQANFSKMITEEQLRTLIYLEDTSVMQEQAQQLKLASLGRLTASIAHELRNPLGAIKNTVFDCKS